MKLRVKPPVGSGAVEVQVPHLPHYMEMREQAAVLAWADERGSKRAVWKYLSGDVDVRQCSTCGEPMRNICEFCFIQRYFTTKPDHGECSAEEWEYRAQAAERLATQLATLSMELSARASTAKSDPIEFEVIPVKSAADLLEEEFKKLIGQYDLGVMASADLDVYAKNVGLVRSNHGLFSESDQSLRKRIRSRLRSPNSQTLTTHDDAGFQVGDKISISGIGDATITGIEHDASGITNVTYEAVLPGALDSINIDFTLT